MQRDCTLAGVDNALCRALFRNEVDIPGSRAVRATATSDGIY